MSLIESKNSKLLVSNSSLVRAMPMTRPNNNNNKANIYTKTIEWLYSWDLSESRNPKRSKLRISASDEALYIHVQAILFINILHDSAVSQHNVINQSA